MKPLFHHYFVLSLVYSFYHNFHILYYGLNKAIKIYNDKNLPKSERAEALKLIVHLVGDAHQPLHVGNGHDAGGNLCGVKWFKRKKLVSLHKVWDVFLVKALYNKTPWLVSETIDKSYPNHPVIDWLHESRDLHKVIYPKHCSKLWDVKHADHLGQSYVNTNLSIVKQRLEAGGIRLANILNTNSTHLKNY